MEITEEVMDRLTIEKLYEVAGWAEERIRERAEGAAAKAVLEYLRSEAGIADLADRAEAVHFPADHWDDGYWYDERHGVVMLADGAEEEVDFHETQVHGLVSDLSRAQRNADGIDQYSRLTIDLVTGKVDHDRVA